MPASLTKARPRSDANEKRTSRRFTPKAGQAKCGNRRGHELFTFDCRHRATPLGRLNRRLSQLPAPPRSPRYFLRSPDGGILRGDGLLGLA